MSDQKHTQEPWKVYNRRGALLINAENQSIDMDASELTPVKILGYGKNDVSNAERIVACVNAMVGVDDPEAFMNVVRDVQKWLNK